jgi:hypothetical protein
VVVVYNSRARLPVLAVPPRGSVEWFPKGIGVMLLVVVYVCG